jgi:hypothetical protein
VYSAIVCHHLKLPRKICDVFPFLFPNFQKLPKFSEGYKVSTILLSRACTPLLAHASLFFRITLVCLLWWFTSNARQGQHPISAFITKAPMPALGQEMKQKVGSRHSWMSWELYYFCLQQLPETGKCMLEVNNPGLWALCWQQAVPSSPTSPRPLAHSSVSSECKSQPALLWPQSQGLTLDFLNMLQLNRTLPVQAMGFSPVTSCSPQER